MLSINTNEIQTSVLVGNGETLVLGGIYRKTLTAQNANPYFERYSGVSGKAFRRKIERQDQQELLVFITPTLARQDRQGDWGSPPHRM